MYTSYSGRLWRGYPLLKLKIGYCWPTSWKWKTTIYKCSIHI